MGVAISNDEKDRYPLGRFQSPAQIDAEQRKEWIDAIRLLPARLHEAVTGLDEAQLETPYREGGWTVRQVVHHVADSHMNSYIRFRWALTEDSPLIKAYEEALWAELPDAKAAPIALSLSLLEALHARWVILLESMGDAAFARTLKHPQLGDLRLDWLLGLYAWHSRHHTAHITTLRNRLSL